VSGPFTSCPNGRHEEGYPHDFCGYQPGEREDPQPLMFCERCGEVRALALAPVEETADRRVFGDIRGGPFAPATAKED